MKARLGCSLALALVAGVAAASASFAASANSSASPPNTRITAKPASLTNSANAVFRFTATKSQSRFSCRLDDGAFAACVSPKRYSRVADGHHSFRVRASKAGKVDPTPAAFTWTVDTMPPETTIGAHPPDSTTARTATFSFGAAEEASSFECALDGAAFEACATPMTYSGLSVSEHTFQVRATDRAGNRDATPARFTWTVTAAPGKPENTAPPTISGAAALGETLTAAPGSWTNSPASYGYQWQRCDAVTGSCSDIFGSSLSTYSPELGDVASAIRVVVTASNPYGAANAVSSATTSVAFTYRRELFGPVRSLVAFAESLDPATGTVTINGVDTQQPTIPFTFSWGDGTSSQGFFSQTHRYADRSRNYLVEVTAHYFGAADSAAVPVDFVAPALRPVPFPAALAVTIPSQVVPIGSTQPGYSAPPLSFFDDSFFTHAHPRATAEYVFSQAATVENALLEGDHALVNGAFHQVILRAPTFGGAFSLWFTAPVALAAGDSFFGGTPAYSSVFHEMGHNFTLNAPAAFRYGGKIDGNANAIVSESLAQMFQHATAYELVNNARAYGLPSDLAVEIAASAESSMTVLRAAYDNYVANGKPFTTWNDPATSGDETFGTFMTVAYVFCKHAEAGGNYVQPLQRVMRLLRTFNPALLSQYAPGSNTAAASTFRSTLMVTALSYGFSQDLRPEFRDLGFPVDDSVYTALYNSVGS